MFLSGRLFLRVLTVLLFSSTIIVGQELKLQQSLPMPTHEVDDVSGRSLSFNEVAKPNGLLVIFSCNTCPWVSKWEDRYLEISNYAELNNIGVIALNPNERTRNRGESIEDMKKHSDKLDYNFYYALDKNHVLADAFGATKTPAAYLFNRDLKLVYKGAIDDNPNDANKVKTPYLQQAMRAMISNSEIVIPEGNAAACLIKRLK